MAKKSYDLILKNVNLSPADGSSYMLRQSTVTSGVATNGRIPIPITGIIKEVFINFANCGTLGSSETSSIYLNRDGVANDILLSNAITNDARNTSYTITGLNIAVIKNGYLNVQRVCPTRATNPTSVDISVYITIEY